MVKSVRLAARKPLSYGHNIGALKLLKPKQFRKANLPTLSKEFNSRATAKYTPVGKSVVAYGNNFEEIFISAISSL